MPSASNFSLLAAAERPKASSYWAGLAARFQRWQDRVREPALTVLLSLQVLFIFVASPLASVGLLSRLPLDCLDIALPLVSFFALHRQSKVRLLILLSIVPMAWILVAGANVYFGVLLRMVVMLAVTGAVVQAVFQARQITQHQLLGAVVVYLNLALLFMGAFAGIRFLFPQAFATLAHVPPRPGELLYFSLTTLTSTGYGDIVPVHPLARSLANAEAVVGQLFLAIFMARLVSLHQRPPTSPATGTEFRRP